MDKTSRASAFILLVAIVLVIFAFGWGQMVPDKPVDVVIFSCLIMLSFVTLIAEHFFTKPSDVIASTVSILLLLGPLKAELLELGMWYTILIGYNLSMLLSAILALFLLTPEYSSDHVRNRISKFLKELTEVWGNGKFLFSMILILMLIYYVPQASWKYKILIGYYAIFIFLNPQKWVVKSFLAKSQTEAYGEIIGVQSNNVFLVKLFDDKKLERFSFVEFQYSILSNSTVLKGLIIDTYLMDKQQWVKVLWIKNHVEHFGNEVYNTISEENKIYLIKNSDVGKSFLNKFLGIVVENSDISKVRFDYNSPISVSEGTLIQLQVNNHIVIYQVVNALTKVENLDNKNENSRVIGEAIQLGEWNPAKCCFEKFGWVPDVNSPVFLAQNLTTIPIITSPCVSVGVLPSTNYPVILDTELAITHHTAILGVTGCGKSTFARYLIEKFAERNKVICVDFTGEYQDCFRDHSIPLVSEEAKTAIQSKLHSRRTTPNQTEKARLSGEANTLFIEQFRRFSESQTSIAIFDLPGLSNTTSILDYTQQFFESLFHFAQQGLPSKICVVLEEAHTIVPETSNLGDLGDYGANKAVVNKIGQIALQGRKYGIGFLVIAQRTANVSKTVLTQCNTVIAFQAFDKTSFGFLESYLGEDIIHALSSLRFRHAVMIGKAFKSTHPIIVEIPDLAQAVTVSSPLPLAAASVTPS